MGLNGYRNYREAYKDDGLEKLEILQAQFSPDFNNRNTIQVWDASNHDAITILKWIGSTLSDRTMHEITIVNNSNVQKEISFAQNYLLSDETTVDINDRPNVVIGPMGTAYFYCTAIMANGNLELEMRTGSQDDRKA